MKVSQISLTWSLGLHSALAQHNLSWSPPGPGDGMCNYSILNATRGLAARESCATPVITMDVLFPFISTYNLSHTDQAR